MNNRNFPVHGRFHFSLDGPLLIVEGEGPGNIEVAIQYQKEVQPYRDQIKHRPWASLAKMHGLPLLPPEAKEMMSQSIAQAMQENLVATAVLLVDVEFAGSARQFWTEVYQQTSLPYAFFEEEKEARSWLLNQLDMTESKKGA